MIHNVCLYIAIFGWNIKLQVISVWCSFKSSGSDGADLCGVEQDRACLSFGRRLKRPFTPCSFAKSPAAFNRLHVRVAREDRIPSGNDRDVLAGRPASSQMSGRQQMVALVYFSSDVFRFFLIMVRERYSFSVFQRNELVCLGKWG